MNFFLARVWVVTLYLLHQMVGRHLLEKLIPFLDKVPWPVRQKEASQVTFPQVAIPVFPVGPRNAIWILEEHL